jgi:hypothetical protein
VVHAFALGMLGPAAAAAAMLLMPGSLAYQQIQQVHL